MRKALFGMLALSFGSAAQAGWGDKLPPEAYVDPIDQQIASTGKGLPGRPVPCAYEETQNGVEVVVSRPTELCVKMGPLVRFRGLWRAAFEGSRFCPEPARTCDVYTPGEDIWLSRTPGRPRGELYRVDFYGRKTVYRGSYGHGGISDNEITMEQVVKMELLSKPRAPSKASIEEMKRNCAAKFGCDVKQLIADLNAIYRE